VGDGGARWVGESFDEKFHFSYDGENRKLVIKNVSVSVDVDAAILKIHF